ncbi:uncharacterized protein TM35_000301660 [Trypanosoma theileri]|uniref:Uncharacterized protein n=1 Tax=Trypanosoma theileri TaxID=67003 RepID=A0A1X0NN33_9TRYP|nr:uncharacterized protein TM35_000301660 [Trypanosoma theileri]ORC86126.1 hypothetical protein TM35_000301660 [Trypanosoma theileri]
MTTMFIQLRRVVYLLVLLQFCTCMALGDDKVPSVAKESEVKIVEQRLKTSVDKVYELLVEGNSCLSVWKDEVVECNRSTGDVKTAAEETKGLIEKIEKTESITNEGEEVGSTDKLLQDVNASIRVVGDAVKNTRARIKDTMWISKKCTSTIEKLKEVAGQLRQDALHFPNLLDSTTETPRRLRLAREGSGADGVVTNLIGNLTALVEPSRETVVNANLTLKEVKNATKEVIDKLHGKTPESPITNVTEEVQRIMVLGEVQIRDIERLWEKNATDITEDGPDFGTIRAKWNRAHEEEQQRADEEKAKRTAEDERDAEEERRIAEEKARMEEEKLAAAEKEKLVEKEKLAAEEKARKAKEDELARTAKKETDNSSSPALVHSPILLLVLLCVLGCSLMC